MQITAADVLPGMVVLGEDRRPWQVIHCETLLGHWNIRRRLRLRALEADRTCTADLRPSETVELVPLAERSLTFLYRSDTGCVFLDPESGSEYELPVHLCCGWDREPEAGEPVLGGFHRESLRVVIVP